MQKWGGSRLNKTPRRSLYHTECYFHQSMAPTKEITILAKDCQFEIARAKVNGVQVIGSIFNFNKKSQFFSVSFQIRTNNFFCDFVEIQLTQKLNSSDSFFFNFASQWESWFEISWTCGRASNFIVQDDGAIKKITKKKFDLTQKKCLKILGFIFHLDIWNEIERKRTKETAPKWLVHLLAARQQGIINCR